MMVIPHPEAPEAALRAMIDQILKGFVDEGGGSSALVADAVATRVVRS
jgi:hypothetical protein